MATVSPLAVPTRTLGTVFALAALVGGTQGALAKVTPVVIGNGNHTYEWIANWPRFPVKGMFVGATHGDVVVDGIASTSAPIHRTRSSLSRPTVGARGLASSFVGGAHGLRLVKEAGREVIWLTHTKQNVIVKLSLSGEVLLTLTYPQQSNIYKDAKEFVPTAVDIAPNGDIYAVDGYGKGYVHQWTAEGEYVRSWDGSSGTAGPFKQPHGVGIDTRGPTARVVVADRQNHRLQMFALDGTFVGAVQGDLRLPSKIVVHGDDLLVVDLQGRLTILDKDYQVVVHLGDNSDPALRGKFDVPPSAWRPGEFIAPHGAAWDSKGNLYVQDWNAYGRVTKLRRVSGRR